MNYETAAEAFEEVKTLALDPNNELFFIWIANAAIKHYEEHVIKCEINVLRKEKFSNKEEKLKAISKLNEALKCLEIIKTIREWMILSNAEQSAPAMVKTVMDMYNKPDIDVTKSQEIKEYHG